MPRKYSKLAKDSAQAPARRPTHFDYATPRSSGDIRNSMDSSFRAPGSDKDNSDDEVDNLLSEDPLYDEKRSGNVRGRRMSRKSRRILIFGLLTLLLGIVGALSVVGFKTHARVKAMEKATQEAKESATVYDTIKDMTEVPSLTGMLPLAGESVAETADVVDDAGPQFADHAESEQTISVPETKIDWENEAADKALYEAEAAKDTGYTGDEEYHDPPELGAEAISQAQGVNAQLDELSSSVANSVAKGKEHNDVLASMKATADDLWAWLEAQWQDMVGNSPDSGETIY